MADIFAGTQPPAWLQNMTAQQPGELGSIFGQIVGGLADSAEIAIASAKDKQAQGIDTNWIKELPGSIQPGLTEARLNIQNPLWRMQVQQAQLNMAQQHLQMQGQQSQIDARATAMRMQEHDQQVLPQWLQDHPTWESRQDAEPPALYTSAAQKMFRDVQLGDAGNIKHKVMTEGVTSYYNDVNELSKLNAQAAVPFAQQAPNPKSIADLSAALDAARAQKKVEDMPQDLTVGRTRGVYNPGTKKFTRESQPKPPPTPKLSAALNSELTLGRERILAIEKAMSDPINSANKGKMAQLNGQLKTANDYYHSVLSEARTVQQPSAETEEAAPTERQDDPLNLGVFK